jgi:hypothetical protein
MIRIDGTNFKAKFQMLLKYLIKKKFMVGKFLKIIIFMIIIEKNLKGKEITYL